MITIVARFQAQPGKEAELRAVLEGGVANVKEKERNNVVVYSLHVSDTDPAQFLFYEQYPNAEALAAHGGSDHMRALFGQLRGLTEGRAVIERYTQIAGL